MSINVTMPDGTIRAVTRLLTPPGRPQALPSQAQLDRWASMPQWKCLVKRHERGIYHMSDGGNRKLAKGQKKEIMSVGLMLAPNKESGFSVCADATPGCIQACIFHSGLTEAFASIKPSQIAKTRAFFQQRKEFDRMLLSELQAYSRKYPTNLVCRLNVLSDIFWERVCPWIFELLPDVIFYDYCKNLNRMMKYLSGDFPKNYSLTFSRSERNHSDCLKVLEAGGNVAVVFKRKTAFKHSPPVFPEEFMGYPVIDGDQNDLRYTDPSPCIVGLKAKGKRGWDDATGFVVDSTKISLPVVS